MSTTSLEEKVIADFGCEWQRFDQSQLPEAEEQEIFDSYFRIFPWASLPTAAIGMDLGCGSGRWARRIAPRVGHLHCLDPSAAIDIAIQHLAGVPNCSFHRADAAHIPLPNASLDFAVSLGVLHHVVDTRGALRAVAARLKPGAPFLIYLYYAFDNQPAWYRWIWRLSDMLRRSLVGMPRTMRNAFCDAIAAIVYWPLARAAAYLEKRGHSVRSFPLAFYRHRSFYVMRTDALDRFGTKLEKRFTRAQVEKLLRDAGFDQIRFSESAPFWCALGFRCAD